MPIHHQNIIVIQEGLQTRKIYSTGSHCSYAMPFKFRRFTVPYKINTLYLRVSEIFKWHEFCNHKMFSEISLRTSVQASCLWK